MHRRHRRIRRACCGARSPCPATSTRERANWPKAGATAGQTRRGRARGRHPLLPDAGPPLHPDPAAARPARHRRIPVRNPAKVSASIISGAFVFALRAAGLPARVVTGYQGGEINPFDGYFTVRQYDAHAWAEVWLKDRGWTRIDPTALSVPLAHRTEPGRRRSRRLQRAVHGAPRPRPAARTAAAPRCRRQHLEPVGDRLQPRAPARIPRPPRHAARPTGGR